MIRDDKFGYKHGTAYHSVACKICRLIPGEDDSIFAQCHSVCLLQSLNQMHNRCGFQNFSSRAALENKYDTESTSKLHEKNGRLVVHGTNHFRKPDKSISHLVTFTVQTFGFKPRNSWHELVNFLKNMYVYRHIPSRAFFIELLTKEYNLGSLEVYVLGGFSRLIVGITTFSSGPSCIINFSLLLIN